MAPEEAQQNSPRRRGRPPGSKNRTTTTTARRKRAGAGDLVGQLNAMVAELISKNRKLQSQVNKLSQRASTSAAGKSVERGLRTISRRVQRALSGGTKKRRRTTAASGNGRRRKPATTRKRKTT